MTVYAGDPIYAADVNAFEATSTTTTTASSTFTTTETEVISHTHTLIDGRKYEITATGSFKSTVAGDSALGRIRLTDTSGTVLAAEQTYIPTTSGSGYGFAIRGEYTAGADGDQEFILSGQRNLGTGNVSLQASSTQPATLSVRLMA